MAVLLNGVILSNNILTATQSPTLNKPWAAAIIVVQPFGIDKQPRPTTGQLYPRGRK
jgi:hypothetical protein